VHQPLLGISEKDVAIEYPRIERMETDGEVRFVLDTTQEELDAAPEFQTANAQADEQADPALNDSDPAMTDGSTGTPPTDDNTQSAE
jgi:hypothetical protein